MWTTTEDVNRVTLLQAMPNWQEQGKGLFTNMGALPWSTLASASLTDQAYFLMRSGHKLVSPFLRHYMTDGLVDETSMPAIATLIRFKFINNWTRLWETYSSELEYNPIHNYNMSETEQQTTTDNNRTSTLTKSKGSTSTETTTKGITDTIGVQLSETTQGSLVHGETESVDHTITNDNTLGQIYGFNSSSPSDANQQTRNLNNESTDTVHGGTDSNSETRTGTQSTQTSHSGTDTVQTVGSGADTDTDVKTGSTTVSSTRTRQGNIGVTTTQQMLEAEREVWMWDFFDKVFSDVDSVLALSVYGNYVY